MAGRAWGRCVPCSRRLHVLSCVHADLWRSCLTVWGKWFSLSVPWRRSPNSRAILPPSPRVIDALLIRLFQRPSISSWDFVLAPPPLIYVYFGHRASIIVVNTSDSDEPTSPMPDDSLLGLVLEMDRWGQGLKELEEIVSRRFCPHDG